MPQTPRNPQQQGSRARPKPHLLSMEGFVMLTCALLIDIVNIFLGFLDFIAIGLILSPIWNAIALGTVGVWLWVQTGQDIKRTKRKQNLLLKLSKRVVLPFIGNSIPIAKFFPFWVWSVWGALDTGRQPAEETEEQEEQQEQPQAMPDEQEQPQAMPDELAFLQGAAQEQKAEPKRTLPPAGWTGRPSGLVTPPAVGTRQTGEERMRRREESLKPPSPLGQSLPGQLERSKEVFSIEEVGSKVSEQIRQVEENGIVFDETTLRERQKSLAGRPIIDSSVFREATAVLEEEPTFSWVETDKIVGRPFANQYQGGWSFEYGQRKGRIVEVAKELSGTEQDEQKIEHIFHPAKPNERIRLSVLEGPGGPMYSVEDGTHRVAGAMVAGLREIPADVKKIKYPLERLTTVEDDIEDWQKKIELGLIQGKIETLQNDEGEKSYKLTVEKEVLPWIRTTSQNEFIRINRTYEKLYPGSLDNLKVPRDALIDPVANNYFMAGRWKEWEEKFSQNTPPPTFSRNAQDMREFAVIKTEDLGSLQEASRWEAEQGKEKNYIEYPVYKVKGDKGEVTYVGTHHFNSRGTPESDAMIDIIERTFRDAAPDIVFVEGLNGLQDNREKEIEFLTNNSYKDVLAERGENGFTAKLALENGVEVRSPEPNTGDTIEFLENQGYTKDEIFGYYFYRMVPQYQRKQREGTMEESFEEYIRPTLEEFKERTNWDGFDYSVEHASKIGKDILGKELDLEDEAFYEKKTWPLILDSPQEETVLNRVSREGNALQNVHAVNQMGEALKNHKRLFIVYGGTHSLVQKPAIEKLLQQKAQESHGTVSAPNEQVTPSSGLPEKKEKEEIAPRSQPKESLGDTWMSEFGLVFDPEAELARIRQLPSEQRREALPKFKKQLAAQRESFMALQEQLVQAVQQNPDRSADELYQIVTSSTEQHHLPPARKILIRDVLADYEKRHKFVQGLREQYPDDNALYEKLFGRAPQGSVEIKTNPSSFFVKISDPDDYVYAYSGEKLGILGLKSKDVIEYSKKQATNSGGALLHDALIPELNYSLAIANLSAIAHVPGYSKKVATHEEQHSLYNLRRQFLQPAVDQELQRKERAEIYAYAAMSNSGAASKEEVAEAFGKLATSYRKVAAEFAGNEVLANFKDGSTEYDTRETLAPTYGDSLLYDYLKKTREGLTGSNPPKAISQEEWGSIVGKELDTKYKSHIRKIVRIPYTLERQGYSKEQVLALLEQEPVSRWQKVANRLIKETRKS